MNKIYKKLLTFAGECGNLVKCVNDMHTKNKQAEYPLSPYGLKRAGRRLIVLDDHIYYVRYRELLSG